MAVNILSVPRPSFSSVMTHSSTPEHTGRWSNKKENQFIVQHGSKLHAYGRDKAPYPLSYNREVLELWCIDHALMLSAKQAISFIDFKGNTPKRCLDIGTGLGDWVIDAAKQWSDCTFVGYDLVNVQLPLYYTDPDIASRVQWVHGNILRQKLPFEDDEFDHVHIQGMAFAVPENKWPAVYEEVNRVLRPGGTVEEIEEDATFPILPRWFTGPLHAQARRPSALFPDGTQRPLQQAVQPEDSEPLAHDHMLLESLFRSVFENRFINSTPSSVLPQYFSAVFRHVLSPPMLKFHMPPFAPLTPLPEELNSLSPEEVLEESDIFLPDPPPESSRPGTARSEATFIDSASTSACPSYQSTASSPGRGRTHSLSTTASSTTTTDSVMSSSSRSPSQRRSLVSFTTPDESTRIGDETALELFPMEIFGEFDEQLLFMQLYRAVGLVLATKEAMWDELKERLKRERGSLAEYGWRDEEFLEDVSRRKFDALVERYKGDMHVRISLWYSLTKSGWPYPPRDPLSKAELIEEERLRRDISEARKQATKEELEKPTRTLRLMVGIKALDLSEP